MTRTPRDFPGAARTDTRDRDEPIVCVCVTAGGGTGGGGFIGEAAVAAAVTRESGT